MSYSVESSSFISITNSMLFNITTIIIIVTFMMMKLLKLMVYDDADDDDDDGVIVTIIIRTSSETLQVMLTLACAKVYAANAHTIMMMVNIAIIVII